MCPCLRTTLPPQPQLPAPTPHPYYHHPGVGGTSQEPLRAEIGPGWGARAPGLPPSPSLLDLSGHSHPHVLSVASRGKWVKDSNSLGLAGEAIKQLSFSCCLWVSALLPTTPPVHGQASPCGPPSSPSVLLFYHGLVPHHRGLSLVGVTVANPLGLMFSRP